MHQDDIGKPRDQVTSSRLAELNSYVPVSVFKGELNQETIRQFQVFSVNKVVALTGSNHEERLRLNDLCRSQGVSFIAAETMGLFGFAFNDFGPKFIVSDTNGEQAKSGMISAVSKDNDGVVACIEDSRHGLEDGDYVTFTEVQGMTELNGIEPRKVTTTGPFTFKIGDTSSFADYKAGGYFNQVKMGKEFNFKTFRESFKNPEILTSDFAKFDRPLQLHLCFQALDVYVKQYSQLPLSRNDKNATEFLEIVKKLAKELQDAPELNDKLIKEFAFQARGDVPAMNAVLGGFVAQEVLKASSGKFMPIHQYMYFDSLESMPKAGVTESDAQPLGTRYDSQIAVFGQGFMNKIAGARQFLVGAGAIGCEMLKNWAMMGLGKSLRASHPF